MASRGYSCLTVVAGVAVYAGGHLAVAAIVQPIHRLRELIGEIAQALSSTPTSTAIQEQPRWLRRMRHVRYFAGNRVFCCLERFSFPDTHGSTPSG